MAEEDVCVWGTRHDESEYNIGSIMKFEAVNFMTFRHFTCYPGPTLNVVAAPNGSGKSSLVCGLCMGLGGKTQLLGRADHGKDFIKRGCNSSWTEIELRAEPRKLVVGREMRIQDGSCNSIYKVNNVQKSQKEVIKLMDDLNIQLDNLCQFLPQDKVVEFARLNPMELLIATEKALGDANLYNQHKELIELSTVFKEHEESCHATADSLRSLEHDHERQRRDYERYQQRESLLKEAKAERCKVLWIEVSKHQQAVQEAELKQGEAQQQLQKLKDAEKGDSRPVRLLKAQADKAAAEFKQKNAAFKQLESQFRAYIKNLQTLGDKFHIELANELGALKPDSDRRKEDIRRKQGALQQAQQQLQGYPSVPPEDLQRLDQLARKHEQQREKVADLEQQQEVLQHNQRLALKDTRTIEGRIAKLENQNLNRLNILERSFRGIREAHAWVQAQQRQGGFFRDQVFGPVALEVKVDSPLSAQYLESDVNWSKWAQFVALNREDETKLTEYFRKQNWSIPTAAFTANWNCPIPHYSGSASDHARLGITHTLDELFDAHPVIKHFLGVGNTYIATRDCNVEGIKQAGIRKFYTPESRVSITVSHYNRAAVSTSEAQLKDCNLLRGNGRGEDELQATRMELAAKQQELDRLTEQLRGVTQHLEGARIDLDTIHELYDQQQKQIDQHVARRKNLQNNVSVAAAALHRAQETPEPMDREAGIRKEMERVAKELTEKGARSIQLVDAVVKDSWRVNALELKKQQLSMQVTAAESEEDRRKLELRRLEALVRDLEQSYRKRGDNLKNSLAEAKKEDPEQIGKAAWKQQQDEANQQGEALPTADELLARAEQLEDEAQAIRINNPAVAMEYTTRQRSIKEQKAILQRQQNTLAETRQKMQDIKAAWLPELEQLITKVNTTFSANFSEIACAGEVELAWNKDAPEDYDKYRIEVKVKFRETEELQVLTAHRQSGGERSVSTILYLIALQGVTQTPFRVVDEINQGMDPVNERKVFDQLVAAASKPNTPQCFLLTPKLLPGLDYGSKATILCIFNGTQMDQAVTKNLGPVGMFGTRLLKVQRDTVAAA